MIEYRWDGAQIYAEDHMMYQVCDESRYARRGDNSQAWWGARNECSEMRAILELGFENEAETVVNGSNHKEG